MCIALGVSEHEGERRESEDNIIEGKRADSGTSGTGPEAGDSRIATATSFY